MTWDIGILWEWQYDERFIKLMDSLCYKRGKKSYLVSNYNLHETIEKIINGSLKFRTVLDRATDCNTAFMPLVHLLQKQGSRIIEEPAKTAHSNDKTIMHIECLKNGLNVPESIILFPNDEIKEEMLYSIGIPFVIKPEVGGGGEGVVTEAFSVSDIINARSKNPNMVFIIQKKITPREVDRKRYWFRVFFVCGKIIPCFWNDITHVSQRLSPSEGKISKELIRIIKKISKFAELEFFSTEIAELDNGNFFVIDYVNDQCDMRFQSDAIDGVPDSVIKEIIEAIIDTL